MILLEPDAARAELEARSDGQNRSNAPGITLFIAALSKGRAADGWSLCVWPARGSDAAAI
jgi:hypothetical protein